MLHAPGHTQALHRADHHASPTKPYTQLSPSPSDLHYPLRTPLMALGLVAWVPPLFHEIFDGLAEEESYRAAADAAAHMAALAAW